MGLDSVKTPIFSDKGLCQCFDGCVTLYKDYVKQSSAYDRQLIDIAESISNNFSGNKIVKVSPEDRYYESNEWYAQSKSNNDKILKAHSGRNGVKKASKSGG